MKNLTNILLIVCCVNVFAEPQYSPCVQNEVVILQLQKLQAQLQELQIENTKLVTKNQQLHNALTIVQNDWVQMSHENSKLKKQVVHLQTKIQRFLPQSKKYDRLYKEHASLKTKYKEVRDKVNLDEKKYNAALRLYTNNEKLQWQNSQLTKKNAHLQKKAVALQKNCKQYQSKYDKLYKAHKKQSRSFVKPQANYAIKFVGEKMQRAYIESEMFKLANVESFSVVATEKDDSGVEVKIHYADKNVQHLARVIVRRFAKQGIYTGVTKIAAQEITMRISPWSVYSS
ncbi:hypothetical protein [Candidatus Uabimicrobium amorphum]|uniref:Uncharacterized protein n=1 Tax=Uabimicrobium amorphum TaxID=2596890 RepID=A0A5S9IKF2_UABAM|nr:hypothetical protein [Candidatus Uabimicrobium amorphum]BBM83509.1 hypothetical protein UABAM_01861 [Candidatus Uabimicrobium amorphum]